MTMTLTTTTLPSCDHTAAITAYTRALAAAKADYATARAAKGGAA